MLVLFLVTILVCVPEKLCFGVGVSNKKQDSPKGPVGQKYRKTRRVLSSNEVTLNDAEAQIVDDFSLMRQILYCCRNLNF